MIYTLCIHIRLITIRKNVCLDALNSHVEMQKNIICLQLRELLEKREVGNRYGPY